MRPNLGNIENIPSVLVTIVNGHNLNVQSPRSTTTLSNVLEEILSSIIRIGGFVSISFSSSEILNTRISLEMKLNPEGFTLFINPLESVR